MADPQPFRSIAKETLLLAAHFPTPALNAATAAYLAHFKRPADFVAAGKKGLFNVTILLEDSSSR